MFCIVCTGLEISEFGLKQLMLKMVSFTENMPGTCFDNQQQSYTWLAMKLTVTFQNKCIFSCIVIDSSKHFELCRFRTQHYKHYSGKKKNTVHIAYKPVMLLM